MGYYDSGQFQSDQSRNSSDALQTSRLINAMREMNEKEYINSLKIEIAKATDSQVRKQLQALLDEKLAEIEQRKKKLLLFLLPFMVVFGVFSYYFFLRDTETTSSNNANPTPRNAVISSSTNSTVQEKETQESKTSSINENRKLKNPINQNVSRNLQNNVIIEPKNIVLDSYTGYLYENAVDELSRLEIPETQINRIDQFSDTIESGMVISQTPAPGETVVPKNVQVTLYVSKGIEKVTLSDYSEISYDNAVSRLVALGIPESQIKRVDEKSDRVEKDSVISQEPAFGTAVDPKNDTIILHVSKGNDSVIVPDILGYSSKAVEDKLNSIGLRINEKGLFGSGDGQVVERVTPTAGSKVKIGDTITVYYSQKNN